MKLIIALSLLVAISGHANKHKKTEAAQATSPCMSVPQVAAKIDGSGGLLRNFRMAVMIPSALLTYADAAKEADPPWQEIWLVDSDSGGFLFAGYSNQICEVAAFDEYEWNAIARALDGDKS